MTLPISSLGLPKDLEDTLSGLGAPSWESLISALLASESALADQFGGDGLESIWSSIESELGSEALEQIKARNKPCDEGWKFGARMENR